MVFCSYISIWVTMGEDGISNQFTFATIDYEPRYTSSAQQENRRQHDEVVRPGTAHSTVRWGQDKCSTPRPASLRTVQEPRISNNGAQTVLTRSETSPPSSQERKSSILGLFSVKEPSSQALKEYEELLKKQQNRDKGRPSAVGMPMISAAKLPSNVPKVNSKWDGLPAAVRQKHYRKKEQKWEGSANASRLPSTNSSRSSLRMSKTESSPPTPSSYPGSQRSTETLNTSGSLSLSSYATTGQSCRFGSSSTSVNVTFEPIQTKTESLTTYPISCIDGCRDCDSRLKAFNANNQRSMDSEPENPHLSSSIPFPDRAYPQATHKLPNVVDEIGRSVIGKEDCSVSLTASWSKPVIRKSSGNFFKSLKSKRSLYFSREAGNRVKG